MQASFAFIFDMNGVIIDDERIHQDSWRQLCKHHNLSPTEEEFKHNVFGRTEIETIKYLFGDSLTESEIAHLLEERVNYAIETFKAKLKPTSGLLSFLDRLSLENVPVGMATSSRRKYLNFILDGLEIIKHFKAITTAEEIENGKPAPDIYLKTAEKMNTNPNIAIAIEDSVSGIKSAKAAGMKVIGITTTHTASEIESADLIVNNFDQIEIEDLKNLIQSK